MRHEAPEAATISNLLGRYKVGNVFKDGDEVQASGPDGVRGLLLASLTTFVYRTYDARSPFTALKSFHGRLGTQK